MHVRVPGTVLAVLAVGGIVGLGGCATQVHAQGSPDPAMVVSTQSTPTETSSLPTSSPTTPSVSLPPPTVDPATERRITCLLITPSVGQAITAWNNYVDKKGGTRTSVAGQLTTSAATIDGVLRTSTLGVHDVVRGWALKVSQTLKTMAATLRAGRNPSVSAFNSYKSKLQQACSG